MKLTANRIVSCLWFDSEAEEAARFYVSIFENSRIGGISHYGEEGHEIHGRKAGTVMTAEFEIAGQNFVALNGGPHFKFSEATSFQVMCDTQEKIDFFWSRLSQGGQEGPCGWLKDKFGLSWQVVPIALIDMLKNLDTKKSQRVTRAFLQMKKFDIAALKRVFESG